MTLGSGSGPKRVMKEEYIGSNSASNSSSQSCGVDVSIHVEQTAPHLPSMRCLNTFCILTGVHHSFLPYMDVSNQMTNKTSESRFLLMCFLGQNGNIMCAPSIFQLFSCVVNIKTKNFGCVYLPRISEHLNLPNCSIVKIRTQSSNWFSINS